MNLTSSKRLVNEAVWARDLLEGSIFNGEISLRNPEHFQRKNTRKIFQDHSRLISLKTPYRYNCSTIRICVPGLFVHVECALRCNHSNKRRYLGWEETGKRKKHSEEWFEKENKQSLSLKLGWMSRDEVIGNYRGFFQGTNPTDTVFQRSLTVKCSHHQVIKPFWHNLIRKIQL